MSVPPESSPPDEQPAAHSDDTTRELPKPAPAVAPTAPAAPQSPWSREYAGPVPTAPHWPQEPEERFAGRPYSPHPPAYAPPAYDPSAYSPPGPSADWTFPRASQQGWPASRPRDSRRGLWTGLTLVAIALVATLIAVLVSSTTSSTSSKSSASGGTTLPSPAPSLAPSPIPSASGPANPSNPSNPLPSLGAVATPPGLLAINYHAYSLSTLAAGDVALGPAEVVQFKKYGLSRVVGLRALTLGATNQPGDDYDADINILRFSSPAAAVAELNYSNTQNKKTASTIPLPGFPNATAFVNKGDSTTGIGIGAFATVGRYQVVVILSGLSANVPTNAQVVAAEAAKVLRAVLPDAATIVPPPGGGSGGPTVPGFPTPTPTGTHA